MEERGRIRRGYFASGVGAAQFALPSALDLLRSMRADPEAPEVVRLSATDVANPYGAILRWPAPDGGEPPAGRGPTRSAGAQVVLVNGRLGAWIGRGRQVLTFLRAVGAAPITCVFGCGGDRDRTKRPLMGAAAARLSDLAVLTSDNPRSEPPEQIIEDIKKGIVTPDRPSTRGGQPVPAADGAPWLAIVDRREAVFRAVAEARPGDMVLVAGKGHERYQEIGGRTLPFDDVEVGMAALAQRRERLAAAGKGRR
jgi:hypothetical protein